MTNGRHLDGPTLEALAAGASMPEAKFHVVECDECRAKLAAMRWENALFAGELREAGEHRPASHVPAPAPLRAQTTWWTSAFSGGFAVPSAVAAVLVLGTAAALAAFLFGNRGGEETAGVQGAGGDAPDAVQVGGDGEKKNGTEAEDAGIDPKAIRYEGLAANDWIKKLREAIDETPDEGTDSTAKEKARNALVWLAPASLPLLIRRVQEDGGTYRVEITKVLAEICDRGDERTVGTFLGYLKHEHYAVRAAAIQALRSRVTQDKAVEAAVREAAKDSDRAVVEAAELALKPLEDAQRFKNFQEKDVLREAARDMQGGDYYSAIRNYEEVLKWDPNQPEAKAELQRARMVVKERERRAAAKAPIVTHEIADGTPAVTHETAEFQGRVADKAADAPAKAPTAGNLLVYPQTFATQASKDTAVAEAKAALMENRVTTELAFREYEALKEANQKGQATDLELQRAKTRYDVGRIRYEAEQAKLRDIEGRTVSKGGAAANANRAKDQDEIARLREQVEKLTQIVQQQKQAVDAGRDEQARMRQFPPEGTVLAIKAEEGLVMVSMGKGQGVQAGQVFGVLRDGRPVARLKVEKVYPDMSSASVLKDSLAPGQTVQVHDEVRMPPPPPRHNMEGEDGMGQPRTLERGQDGGKGDQPPPPPQGMRPKRHDNAGEEALRIPDAPPPPRGEGQDGDKGDQPPPPPQGMRPKRHDNAGEEALRIPDAPPPPRGEGQDGDKGDQPPPPPPPQGMRPKRHDNAGEEAPRIPDAPPPPQGMERGGQGQGQGGRVMFPPPRGPVPPDAPEGDKDKNGADEGLEF